MLDRGHLPPDAHNPGAPASSPAATQTPTSTRGALQGNNSNGSDHHSVATQEADVAADNSGGQQGLDAHEQAAPGASRNGQHSDDAQKENVDREALLLICADALDDLERLRIATENRLEALRRVKGLTGTRAEASLIGLGAAIEQLEHGAELELKRAMRQHPLGPWVKQTVGLGEKQAARLLAAIGDPTWNHAEDRSRRGPAELWAFCGLHVRDGSAPKRRKGERANWSSVAKMRAYLCAESCMKQRHSPYREVYDRERAKWADRETSDLHKHNHALRVVSKAILKDLWREARARAAPTTIRTTPAPSVGEPA